MQNNEIKNAKETLVEIEPYLKKNKLAVEIECHPNTVDNYIKKEWKKKELGIRIFDAAVKQFNDTLEKMNAIKIHQINW